MIHEVMFLSLRRMLLALFLVLVNSAPALAGDDLKQETLDTLKKATSFFRSIATRGGYAGIYSMDLEKRYGEALYEPAKPTEIWVQPPGTPSVGACYLRAYQVTGDKAYLEAARDAARALAWGQRQAGGWDHRVDVSHLEPGSKKPERKKGHCALDDNISQGALSFLMRLDQEINEEWLSESVELGLSHLMRSQFENGAWPQWHPLRGGYHDFYTFNDNTINDCIRVILEAHRLYGKKQYLDCAMRGGDFIMLSRGKAPQAGWAQQYSHDMKPAWARKFEPPGICSAVTARNIRTLVDLYLHSGEEKVLGPIPEAIDWLEKSRIGPDLWARLYEVGTNRPIYGDRDGKVHYTLEEISEERKTGYSWQSGYGIAGAIRYYQEAKSLGADRLLKKRSEPPSEVNRKLKALELASQVSAINRSLDDQGRWVKNKMIQ